MNHLTHEQIILLRSKLLNEKQVLLQDLISEEASLNSSHSYVEDLGELAFDYLDKDITIMLSSQQRKTLRSIDDALTKMGLGNYGKCKICDSSIIYERLDILPFTDLCSEHK